MSSQFTPIFLLIEKSKVLPSDCIRCKDNKPLTDEEIVGILIETIKQIDRDRLDLIESLDALEAYILKKYGEIYDRFENK